MAAKSVQTQDPSPLIVSRLDRCRARFRAKKCQGLLVTNPVDQYYLTGFDGEDGAVLVLARHVYLVTDGRFQEAAEKQAPWARVVLRSGPWAQVVAKLARKHRVEILGFQPAHLSVTHHAELAKTLKPISLIRVPGAVQTLRLTKDDGEIAAIEEAIRVAEKGFLAIKRGIRIGMSEREIAAELQYEMVRAGASEASFPIIVAEGPNASRPHARPGGRKIRVGSAILIDWGATVGYYRSDLTRMLFVRRIPPRHRRMYEQVLAAQQAAIEAIAPGAVMGDVDKIARDRLKQAGMDGYFTHSLGHGLGLDIHEAPRLAPKVKDKLAPGMVVTVEPGVYYPGIGGVRIEDDILVTDRGARVLSRLPKTIASAVISGGRR